MGIDPLHRYFRPPEGMENDPAYREDVRQQMEMVADEDRLKAAQAREDATFAAEDEAVQWAKDNPDQIPNIFQAIPQLALSQNARGFAQVQATPSRATDTLSPSLRMKLPAPARAYYDEELSVDGDAIGAYDRAEMRHAREQQGVEMAKNNVPFEVIRQFKDSGQWPSALEQQELIRRHTPVKGEMTEDDEVRDIMKIQESAGFFDEMPMEDIVKHRKSIRDAVKASRVVAPPPAAKDKETPTPLKDTLKGMSGASVTPPDNERIKQVQEHMASPEVDETFFANAVKNPNLPDNVRREALEKFRQFAKSPPPREGLTIGQSLARQQKLRDEVASAEKDFDYIPELRRANEAWSTAKGNIDQNIDAFAKSLGVGKSQVVESLLQDEKIPVPGREKEYTTIAGRDDVGGSAYEGIPVRKLLGEFMGSPATWNQINPVLAPLAKSKFADRLGTATPKTYGDVLQAYLEEKTAPAKPAVEEMPAPKTPEEAAQLPPGTKFRKPDGTVAIVPAK